MKYARITVDPDVVVGKPCVRGTRITVELILRKVGSGMSIPELLDAYPSLKEEEASITPSEARDSSSAQRSFASLGMMA